jgi:sulfur carrier protein ThiS
MRVTVKLFGTLRRFSNPATPGLWQGDLPIGTKIVDLIKILGTTDAEVAAAALNGEACSLETAIPEDTVVTLVTPVGGG